MYPYQFSKTLYVLKVPCKKGKGHIINQRQGGTKESGKGLGFITCVTEWLCYGLDNLSCRGKMSCRVGGDKIC